MRLQLKAIACRLTWLSQCKRIPQRGLQDKPYAVRSCNYQHITMKNPQSRSQITSMLFPQQTSFFFFLPFAAPLINKTVPAIWKWVREMTSKMLQDALPYPLPVITPIWGSKSQRLVYHFVNCLLFTLGLIALDISKEGVTHNSMSNQLLQPILHTQKNKSSHC